MKKISLADIVSMRGKFSAEYGKCPEKLTLWPIVADALFYRLLKQMNMEGLPHKDCGYEQGGMLLGMNVNIDEEAALPVTLS